MTAALVMALRASVDTASRWDREVAAFLAHSFAAAPTRPDVVPTETQGLQWWSTDQEPYETRARTDAAGPHVARRVWADRTRRDLMRYDEEEEEGGE